MKLPSLMQLLIITCLLLLTGQAVAHPLAPALLEVTHKEDNTYSVLWRLSAVQMKGITPQPVLPEQCTQSTDLAIEREAGLAVASRWDVTCETSTLSGEIIHVQGLDRNPINVVFRLHTREGDLLQTLLDGNRASYTIPSPEQGSQVFTRYLSLGMEHLAFGPDHLLFLLALILIVGMRRHIIWTLTAFTLGHSITLSLASLGIVAANPAIMELGIALSLIVAARELFSKTPSILGRHPASMAAAFGLLHGMGFAGALQDIGLPESDLVSALLAFNIGIEVIQFAIVILLFGVIRLLPDSTTLQRPMVLKYLPGYLIGTLASMWCIERSFMVLL